ncbi:hypothetical protein, conserved [Eimeria brunetti]|uniref:Ion transport domain-containing protein n=1 Tax=Eimeria brunetti TaxID=51314 RepID=U6LMP6_9EIME|nr:hypothetical protein, conserved [Eimeria brunetti]
MAQDAGDPIPLDEALTPRSHERVDPQGDEGLSNPNRQMPLVATTPPSVEGADLMQQHHLGEAREDFGQNQSCGDGCSGSRGSGTRAPSCHDNIRSVEGETRPRNSGFGIREAAHRTDCGGKDFRSSNSNGGSPSVPGRAQERPLFCTVGVHSLTPAKPAARKRASSGLRPQQQQQREQQTQQPGDVAAGDSQREGEEARDGSRCTACGTLKMRAPVGFTFMQNPAPSWGQLRMATCVEAPQAEATGGAGATVPLGTPGTQRKHPTCEDCTWMLPAGGTRLGGPYHLLRQQQQQPKQGELLAGSLQWGHPTSFWLVESDSRIALSSFRLLVTFMVVLSALKYGVSTYFPPAMKLVGLAAIFLRICILVNVGGLGTRVFDPDSLEWKTGIANDFIIGDVQIALVVRSVDTSPSWNNVATATAEKHPFSRIFFVAYICFTTLTLLNIVTGIILDAYVDMSNRLMKEANYKDDLEKDIHNEKLLLSAFEKTSFLVCMRPAVSTLSSEGSTLTTANLEHTTSGWAGGDSGQDSTIPTLLREVETTTTWRHAAASSSMVTQVAASASQSPRAPMCAAGAHFERKLTGVASEDSTARPSTESAADSEPVQIRTHLPDMLQVDGVNVRTCVRYLRIGGHQPMDILRDPIVQDALQAAHIPFYQAFDVLSMFHQRGIQFVTVKEFAEACSRVVGSATGRQLLQVQLEIQQKLCALEQCIRSLSLGGYVMHRAANAGFLQVKWDPFRVKSPAEISSSFLTCRSREGFDGRY